MMVVMEDGEREAISVLRDGQVSKADREEAIAQLKPF